MIIVPFEPEHIRTLILQDAQNWMMPMLKLEYGAAMKIAGPCFTAMEGDEILACSGVAHAWENRDMAWALISNSSGPHFIKIFRAIKRFLDINPARRVEATVDVHFSEGHRLMQMLGFEYEGYLRAYLPDGRDQALYARVRP